MSQITQLLAPKNIVLDLDASSKKRVFEHVGLLFENNQGIASRAVFDSPDGKPVSLLFILLVPEQATEQHLQILSELAEKFSDPTCREALSKAESTDEIRLLFAN